MQRDCRFRFRSEFQGLSSWPYLASCSSVTMPPARGPPIVLLHLLRWLKKSSTIDFDILLSKGGDLEPDYAALGGLCMTKDSSERIWPERIFNQMRRLLGVPHVQHPAGMVHLFRRRKIGLVYSNTVTNGWMLDSLAPLQCPVICHVHELEHIIRLFGGSRSFERTKPHVSFYIAASSAVRNNLIENHQIPEDRIAVVHEFVPVKFFEQNLVVARAEFRQKHKIPHNSVIIGGCGTIEWRKGTDLFVQIAARVRESGSQTDIRFIWMGGSQGNERQREILHDIRKAGLEQWVTILPAESNPQPFFAGIDLFALVSREDPYPLVMLEAAACSPADHLFCRIWRWTGICGKQWGKGRSLS